eukprot:8544981-Lingulodinium_polyedra.AAC.1
MTGLLTRHDHETIPDKHGPWRPLGTGVPMKQNMINNATRAKHYRQSHTHTLCSRFGSVVEETQPLVAGDPVQLGQVVGLE